MTNYTRAKTTTLHGAVSGRMVGYVDQNGAEHMFTPDDLIWYIAPKLARWYRAAAEAAFTPAVVEWAGDSTVYGNYSDNVTLTPADSVADEMSAAGQLRAMCASWYGARAGFIHLGQSAVVVSGGNPLATGFGLGAFGVAYNASGTVTVTVPACTSLTVWVWNDDASTGGGNINGSGAFTVNGGSSTTTTLTAGPNKYKSFTNTADVNAGSTNTVVWTAPAGSYQGFVGVSYDSGKGINVGRWGRGGNTLADFMGQGANFLYNARTYPWLTSGMVMRSAKLLILQFNINESGLPTGSTPANFEANLRAIAAAQIAAGGCMLLIADNEYSGYTNGIQAQFEAKMFQVAEDTPHVGYLKFSELIGNYTTALNNGLMGEASNAIHPNRRGYGILAKFIFRLLALHSTGVQG